MARKSVLCWGYKWSARLLRFMTSVRSPFSFDVQSLGLSLLYTCAEGHFLLYYYRLHMHLGSISAVLSCLHSPLLSPVFFFFQSLNARIESRENWTPAQKGKTAHDPFVLCACFTRLFLSHPLKNGEGVKFKLLRKSATCKLEHNMQCTSP